MGRDIRYYTVMFAAALQVCSSNELQSAFIQLVVIGQVLVYKRIDRYSVLH